MHISPENRNPWRTAILAAAVSLLAGPAGAHGPAGSLDKRADPAREISFPDTRRYKTVVVDLHTHSVFSDGHVWPNIRVSEAVRDGVDLLAITEHLEYQPHHAHIPHKDRNAAYVEAAKAAKETDLLVINGAEITREAPHGHINAVFIEDANALYQLDPDKLPEARKLLEEVQGDAEGIDNAVAEMYALGNLWPAEEALSAAMAQEAFVFWNHSWWTRQSVSGMPVLGDFHKKMIAENKIHGMEIVNGLEISAEAFQIAFDNNLTLIGTSDVHNLVDWDYRPDLGGHRPVTLVLAGQRTEDAVKEALMAGRTVVWSGNTLIGLDAHLQALLAASLNITAAGYVNDTNILAVTLENSSDADLVLTNRTGYSSHDTLEQFTAGAQGETVIHLRAPAALRRVVLELEVNNAFVAPGRKARLTLEAQVR